MSRQTRRHLPASEKTKAVRRHLVDQEPVSKICDELGVSPSNFYNWQQLLFANGDRAFQNRESKSEELKSERRIRELEDKIREREEALAELMTAHLALKKKVEWSSIAKNKWAEPDHRDEAVSFIEHWSARGVLQGRMLQGLGLSRERFRTWRGRRGLTNQHNGCVPRAHQTRPDEVEAILRYYRDNGLEGYRRLTYMMMDEDVAFVSPATTYRVLKAAGLLFSRRQKPSKKGTGFKHALGPHEQWHTDITYIKIKGVFYYLILVLDGFSRYIVSWELRNEMTEKDVEIVIQKGREAFPGTNARIISDCGSQFLSRDFREFIRLAGLSHTTTSPYYPQSNGKLERCNRTIKDFLRTKYLDSQEDGRRLIHEFVEYYGRERLHSAIGYVTPLDKLNGVDRTVQAARDAKLAEGTEKSA